MAWERRRGSRGRYFTRTVRRGGKQVRIYYGYGQEAERAAAEVAERKRQREAAHAERRRWDEALGALAEFCGAVECFARAHLVAAGYYRHHRGEWRRVPADAGGGPRVRPTDDVATAAAAG